MKVDYADTATILRLSFEKLDRVRGAGFPEQGTLSALVNEIFEDTSLGPPSIPNDRCHLIASCAVEMWQRAVHSFLWSVGLRDRSRLWSSVSGYYASHYVMRAFAHSLGIYKSFAQRSVFQLTPAPGGRLTCRTLSYAGRERGEHQFYWRVIKEHPDFILNPLFSRNLESGEGRRGEERSDCMHRNFANYADHIDNFGTLSFPSSLEDITQQIRKLSRLQQNAWTLPQRSRYPDLEKVHVLAYQRIAAFRDHLDRHVIKSTFWLRHRDPHWARPFMQNYAVPASDLELLSGISA